MQGKAGKAGLSRLSVATGEMHGRKDPSMRHDEEPRPDSYLRPSEVAEMLHVSVKTVDRWASQGRLACLMTLGGHRRFRMTDVVAVADEMAHRGGGHLVN
jgi:excisionase family DNA binding protein